MDEKLFLKDRPTYAANFKLSSTPKNIITETLEMSLINLFPNISIGFRIFLIFFYVPVAEAKCTFSLQKRVKNYQHSTMTQGRLNELAV